MSETRQMSGLRGALKFDEPMQGHVSWRAGGAADCVYTPANGDDLGEDRKSVV